MMRTIFSTVLLILLGSVALNAQKKQSDVVQFSGKVIYDDFGVPASLPFVNVYVKNTGRGTVSDDQGFFSLVAKKGETIVFSFVGYQTAEYEIPLDLEGNWYSLIQTMIKDTIYLPQTYVYPWPSREFFEIEFLALQPDQDLQDAAQRNLDPELMALIEERTLPDGNETSDFTLRQTSQNYYYEGQLRPMRVFDAMAWKQFIQAWKNGDFKKKKDK